MKQLKVCTGLLKKSRTSTTVLQQYRKFSTTNVQRERVLITGCLGQIGSELVETLRTKFGNENVVASDMRLPPIPLIENGPFEFLDVLDGDRLAAIVDKYKITWMIHNAAFLSAAAERNVKAALKLNCDGLHNVLEVAHNHKCRVMVPSSIAAFGPSTPQDNTPDEVLQRPTTVYGIGKLYAELLGEYYSLKKGLDFRSLRYPGIISWKTPPGGGTTDYAVDMFYYALRGQTYECYLKPDQALPMMYMPDCIKSTVDLMQAPNDKLKQRVYNVAAVSFTPEQITKAIQKYIPGFKVTYKIDPLRQSIAESWPRSLDDSHARQQWDWKNEFGLDEMVQDMIVNLSTKIPPQTQVVGLKLKV